MHYTRQRPSFILTVTLLTIAALFLTACGTMPQDAAVQDRDPVGIAIAQAESASGFTFAREAVNERVMEGSVATAYVSSRDEALLTVIVSDSQPAELYSWSVVYFEGAEQVVLSMTGEEQRTPVERVLDDEDSVHTLDRCVYCARTVTHPPRVGRELGNPDRQEGHQRRKRHGMQKEGRNLVAVSLLPNL